MNKKKLSSLIALGMLISTSTSSLAEIPRGTVIINDKAYDLDYFNNQSEEFQSVDMDEVVIKDFNGNFIMNGTGERINPNLIPRVTYKDKEVTEYLYGDGDEVKFNIATIKVVSQNTIEIAFNREIKEEALKEAISINSTSLGEKDKLQCSQDKVTITLEKALSSEGKNTISIKNSIEDINGTTLVQEVSSEFMLLNKKSKIEKNYDCDIYLMDDSMTLKDVTAKGNIYIIGSNTSLEKVSSDRNIYVCSDKTTNLKTVKATNIVVALEEAAVREVQADKSSKSVVSQIVNLSGTVADKLVVNGSGKSEIKVNRDTKILGATVGTGASIEMLGGKLGDIDIETKSKEDIEIKGKYEGLVRIWTPIQLITNDTSQIRQVIVNSNMKEKNIDLKANIETLTLSSSKPINIHGKVFAIDCESHSEINILKGAKVSYIATNGNTVKVDNKSATAHKEVKTVTEIDYKENSNTSGGGNWGGGTVTPEKEVYNITGIAPIDPILVKYETPVEKLKLPNKVKVKVKHKDKDKEKEVTVDVVWYTSNYNPYKQGEYILKGEIDLSKSDITNTEKIKAEIKVIVDSQFVIDDVDIFYDQYIRVGTTVEELELPEVAQVMLTTGQIKDLLVVWDKSTFKEGVEGTFTIEGQLDLKDTLVTNPKGLKVEINVIAQKIVVDSIKEAKAIVTTNTPVEEVALPEYVEVTIKNATTNQTRKETIKVDSWSSETYNPSKEGTYEVVANLNAEELASKKIFNDIGVKAVAKVDVASAIRGVSINTTTINKEESKVSINIEREDLHQNMTLTIYNDKNQLIYKDQVKSENNKASFTTILGNGSYKAYIYGIGDYGKVPINIGVDAIVYDIVSINPIEKKLVPYETSVEELNLPRTVVAKVKNGQVEEEKEIGVVWDTSKYNPYKQGEYSMQGTLQLEGTNITNSNNVGIQVKVIVDSQFIIDDVDIFYDEYVRVGTTVEELQLPEVAQVMLTTGQIKDIPVIWDKSTFEEGVEGTFTIEGELDLRDTLVVNPKGLKVEINVIAQKIVVDSIKDAKAIVTTNTPVEQVTLPEYVEVTMKNTATNQTRKETIKVDSWTCDKYEGNKEGEYTFQANLNAEELASKKIYNPSEIKAQGKVTVTNSFEGITTEVTPINETESKVKIRVQHEEIHNNLTIAIYNKENQLIFKDQVRKQEGNEAIFETILANGEYKAYIYGIGDYGKVPVNIVAQNNSSSLEDQYMKLEFKKTPAEDNLVDVEFKVAIKEGVQYREDMTITITGTNEKVLYIGQVKVIDGKAVFRSKLDKEMIKLKLNTHDNNEKSIFEINLISE